MSEESAADEGRPDWWVRNQRLKREHDLPNYEPPRFEDGTYVHRIVPELETKYDCTIRFLGVATDYLDDWEVRVGHTTVMSVGRHRDRNGNTVYETTATEFREEFEAAMRDEGIAE